MRTGCQLPSQLLKFSRWLIANKIDVVHAHHRRLAMLANALQVLSDVPVIYTGHNCFRWSSAFWLLAPSNLTGVSSSVSSYLKHATRARRVDTIWNPYPFQPFPADSAASEEQRTVLSIGRLEPVKGHSHLIQAWHLLKNRGIRTRLRIIGEGKLRVSLEESVRQAGLDDLVTFENYRSDIQDQLRASYFNVLVSQTEGFPNVVIEAAALGKPSLVTNVDGSRDCVPQNAALPNLVPFGQPEDLAVALAQWMQAPTESVSSEGARFHDFLKHKCDMKTIQQAYRDVYVRAAG